MTYEITIVAGRVEALYMDGSKEGRYVSGHTPNGMMVYLSAKDLPFDLADCRQTMVDCYLPNDGRCFRISKDQYAAMTTALAEKVAAQNHLTMHDVPVALVVRKTPS